MDIYYHRNMEGYNKDWPVFRYEIYQEVSLPFWVQGDRCMINFTFEFSGFYTGETETITVNVTNTDNVYVYTLQNCGSTTSNDSNTCYYNCLAQCMSIKSEGRNLSTSEIANMCKSILAPEARRGEESKEEQVLRTVSRLGIDVYVVNRETNPENMDEGILRSYTVINFAGVKQFNPAKSVILLNIGRYHYQLYKSVGF